MSGKKSKVYKAAEDVLRALVRSCAASVISLFSMPPPWTRESLVLSFLGLKPKGDRRSVTLLAVTTREEGRLICQPSRGGVVGLTYPVGWGGGVGTHCRLRGPLSRDVSASDDKVGVQGIYPSESRGTRSL